MLQHIWDWLCQLKAEAPWYFWAYVALTPLNFLVFYQESMILCSLVALVAYVILLMTFGMLRSPSVYIFSVAAYLLTEGYIYEFFLGKNLHLYLIDIYKHADYPEIYNAGIGALCTALVSAVFAFIHKQSLVHALKVCITVLFMIFPSGGGFLLILLPFFAC